MVKPNTTFYNFSIFINLLLFLSNVTSKLISVETLDSLRTFGYHGEALFNMIQLSDKVEIATRTTKENGDFSFKQFIRTIASPIQVLENTNEKTFNTVIAVDQLFYNHTLRAEQLSYSVKRVKTLLKRLEIISLIHFQVRIELEDASEKKLLFVSASRDSLRSKFVEAFALNSEFTKTYLSQVEPGYRIEGSINVLNDQNQLVHFKSTSRIQFIFVNNHYLTDTKAYEIVSNELSSCR